MLATGQFASGHQSMSPVSLLIGFISGLFSTAELRRGLLLLLLYVTAKRIWTVGCDYLWAVLLQIVAHFRDLESFLPCLVQIVSSVFMSVAVRLLWGNTRPTYKLTHSDVALTFFYKLELVTVILKYLCPFKFRTYSKLLYDLHRYLSNLENLWFILFWRFKVF